MALEKQQKNRDGTSIEPNEYAAMVLAVIVPIIGLLLGIYLKTERSPAANRVIGLSIISTIIWLVLVFTI